jgi:tyrosine-protein phosphatase SIW14
VLLVAMEAEDAQNKTTVVNAAIITRSQTTLPSSKDAAMSTVAPSSTALRTAEALVLASAASTPTNNQPIVPEVPMVSNSARPHNFGFVMPGIYRSSYPKPDDYGFIANLKLKTILTLVKKDEVDHELDVFVRSNGIRQIVFNMKGTKKESITSETMESILNIVLNPRNHPLMVHCNHGKHRTGCVVAAVRRSSGWSLQNTLDEYETYAAPKIRECDVEYITSYQATASSLSAFKTSQLKGLRSRSFFRTVILVAVVMTLWAVSGTRLAASSSYEQGP